MLPASNFSAKRFTKVTRNLFISPRIENDPWRTAFENEYGAFGVGIRHVTYGILYRVAHITD